MIDFSEIEPYYGPLAVEDLDAAAAAALNPETEAVDIYDSEAVEGNSTLVTVESMAATIKAATDRVIRVSLAPSQTLTISVNQYISFAALIATSGARQGVQSLRYLAMLGNAPGYSTHSEILTGANIATSLTTSGFTLTNNIQTYNAFVNIVVLYEEPGKWSYTVT